MRNNIGLVGVLLVLFLNLQAQEKIQDFGTFCQGGMKCVEGVLPLYYKDKNIYLEISEELLGREFLITAQIEQGFGKRGRWLKTPGVFRVNRGEGDCLWIQHEIVSERITGKDKLLAGILETSSLQPITREWPIVANHEGQQGYIVNISDILKGRSDWFICDEDEVRGVKEGSIELTEGRALADGVAMKMRGYFGYAPSGEPGGNMLSGEGFMPMEIGCVLKVLPSCDLRLRYADVRIPFRNIHFIEYGENPYGAVKDSVIERWRTEKPLVFYLDSCCPAEWIKYIREGVLAWNKAFRKTGMGKNFLEVKMASQGMCLTAEPLVIAYDLGRPEIKAEWKVNDRTGEILAGRIYIGHGFAWQQRWKYRMQHQAVRKRDEEVMGEILKEEIFRNVGYLLGLKPEVTDIKINPAICLAMTWGYQVFPGNKDAVEDRNSLYQWLNKQNLEEFNQAENLQTLKMAMDHLMDFYQNIETVVYPHGRSDYGNELREVNRQGRQLYNEYLTRALENISGDGVQGQKVMDFLKQYLFDFDPEVLTSPFLKRNPVRNEVALSVSLQPVFEKMLSPEILDRLIIFRDHSDSYTCRKLFGDLDHLLFEDWGADTLTNWQMDLQACYLRAYDKCAKRYEIEKVENEYALKMLSERRRLKEKLQKMVQLGGNKQLRDFYEMLEVFVK